MKSLQKEKNTHTKRFCHLLIMSVCHGSQFVKYRGEDQETKLTSTSQRITYCLKEFQNWQ